MAKQDIRKRNDERPIVRLRSHGHQSGKAE